MTSAQATTNSHRNLYIGGKWEPQAGAGSIDVLSASTEEVIGSVPEGTREDVDRAVHAARAAFDNGWSETTVPERADWLRKLAGALKERTERIAHTIAQEVGSPLTMATTIQAGLPVAITNSYAQMIAEAKLEQEIGNSIVFREPFGVVGAITPWNYPLHQIMAKVAPALAAGCTVVLKPSEVAPLNAFLLAEACEAISLPPG
ncbi:MAG TPA: aldehyde dehydrogenase family protein, partial [Bryobacteraceae bacterium]|nr:aldehyde dehydrogenase family protein [Bryobacteraceae bacterium]